MPGAARKPDPHAALIVRVRGGNREAVLELVDRLQPGSITELVERVFPSGPPVPWQFDLLADAYRTHEDTLALAEC